MLQAKKSYGQHFLKHEAIAARIAGAMQKAGQLGRVLEVGPGGGILTRELLAAGAYEVYAVEADADMVAHLRGRWPEMGERLIHQDFLALDLKSLFGGQEFSLIGNFPYNISTQILFKMLDDRAVIPEMVGMFQKEVADRVVAPPGSKTYGITSVLLQAFYETEYLFAVEPGSFNPPPKVRSAVIRLTRKPEFALQCDEKRWRTIVKTAFNQRRKMLRNTLKPFFPNRDLMSDPQFQNDPKPSVGRIRTPYRRGGAGRKCLTAAGAQRARNTPASARKSQKLLWRLIR